MKQIKTRLCNRITDQNLIHLMTLAIEGPERVCVCVCVWEGENMCSKEKPFSGGMGTFVGGGNVHGIYLSV